MKRVHQFLVFLICLQIIVFVYCIYSGINGTLTYDSMSKWTLDNFDFNAITGKPPFMGIQITYFGVIVFTFRYLIAFLSLKKDYPDDTYPYKYMVYLFYVYLVTFILFTLCTPGF